MVVVAWRFIALLAHGVAVTSYAFLKRDGIAVTLGPPSRLTDTNDRYRRALHRVNAVLYMSLACFAIDFAGLFAAYSLTWHRATLFNALAHAVGAFLVFWAQLDGWSYRAAEYHFALFTLLPACLEGLITSRGMHRHWRELTRPPMTDAQLVASASASVLFALGLPLAIRYIHTSRNTKRLLGPAAWFGIVATAVAILLVAAVVAQKRGLFDPATNAVVRRFSKATVLKNIDDQGSSDDEDDESTLLQATSPSPSPPLIRRRRTVDDEHKHRHSSDDDDDESVASPDADDDGRHRAHK